MNILAIGAHYDDVELGCGGALLRWHAEGHHIFIYVASKSGYAAPNGQIIRDNNKARAEGEASAATLNATLFSGDFETFAVQAGEELHDSLIRAIDASQPNLLLTHWQYDTHHDHRELALATMHVSRRIPRILSYRSNHYQGTETFRANFFVDISPFLTKKMELIKTFQSEHSRTGNVWEEYFTSLAATMGYTAGCRYAEAFEVIKWVE